MTVNLDMVQTAALAVVVLFLGQEIRKKVKFLQKYCIPSPVIGGLLFAILALILKQTGTMSFSMDVTLQKLFMTAFFTTIGFTASLKLLKKGGIQVVLFLGIAVMLVILQDILGVVLARAFQLNPLIGLATGSVPMTGGHGTSGAFGPLFEKAGAAGATTVALASATFGLIMGSMIGGPIAKRLIEKHKLTGKSETYDISAMEEAASAREVHELIPHNLLVAASQILLAMGLGTIVSYFFELAKLTVPSYIGAMFIAALIRNLSDLTGWFSIREAEIDSIGSVSLAIFLSIALMGLQLWQLADLAVPLVVMLVAQAVLMIIFAYFVTFNLMGRDYEAAVVTSGHCGFGMGATPNAMANMQALTAKYGTAPRAFFIIPLVGSLFIDFCNTGIITFFMNFFGK